MRIIRYKTEDEAPRYGWILKDRIGPIDGDIFTEFQRSEANIPFEDVQLLAPVQPSKIICVGRNYAAHAKEHNAAVPECHCYFSSRHQQLSHMANRLCCPRNHCK